MWPVRGSLSHGRVEAEARISVGAGDEPAGDQRVEYGKEEEKSDLTPDPFPFFAVSGTAGRVAPDVRAYRDRSEGRGEDKVCL